jgi:hypothetical protein
MAGKNFGWYGFLKGKKVKIIFDDGTNVYGRRESILLDIDKKLGLLIIEDSQKLELLPISRIVRLEFEKGGANEKRDN